MSTRRIFSVAISFLLVLGICGTAHAATHVLCDAGDLATKLGSSTDGATLSLAPGCTYVFTGNGTPNALVISHSLKIVGNGATLLRNSTEQFRLVDVTSGTVTISSLTITGGHAQDGSAGAPGSSGGGILNEGTLTLSHVTISGNVAGAGGTTGGMGGFGGSGGGLLNASGAKLVLVASRVVSNYAGTGGPASPGSGAPGGSGGGISNDGTLIVKTSRVKYNHGGTGGASGVVPGGSGGSGGGIINAFGATTKIADSVISSNVAGAGGSGMSPGPTGTGGGVFNSDSRTIHPVRTHITANTPDNCAPSGRVTPCH